jgi:hypothetical protein
MQAVVEIDSVEHRKGDILCTLADGQQVWEKGPITTVKARPRCCTGDLTLNISEHRAQGHDAVNAALLSQLRAGRLVPGKTYRITFEEVEDGHQEAPPAE